MIIIGVGMGYKWILFAVVLMMTTGGCKIRVVVPEGGEVRTASGSFVCKSGQTCDIDVVDIHFDETFVAHPDSGANFVAWQSGENTFCQQNSDACKLYTSGFSGNDILLGFLESDHVFYLRPYFATQSSGGGALASQPMKACFKPELFSKGFKTDITTQLYSDSGQVRGSKRSRSEVLGTTTFRGESVVQRSDRVDEDTGSYELTSYTRIENTGFRSTVLGIDQLILDPTPQEFKAVLNPGFLQRFDLAVGETYQSAYDMTISFPTGEGDEIIRHVATELTYEGVEEITTPAGTFSACRVHRFDTIDGDTNETYHWLDRGSGVLLLESDGNFRREAQVVSGTVNGKAL